MESKTGAPIEENMDSDHKSPDDKNKGKDSKNDNQAYKKAMYDLNYLGKLHTTEGSLTRQRSLHKNLSSLCKNWKNWKQEPSPKYLQLQTTLSNSLNQTLNNSQPAVAFEVVFTYVIH